MFRATRNLSRGFLTIIIFYCVVTQQGQKCAAKGLAKAKVKKASR